MNKIKWPALPKIRQTPLTRIAAALLALVLIAALVLVVERQVSNPISARWTVHTINDALRTKYPGEGYVVGNARYTYADGKRRYVCPVYQTGEEDVGFSAYVSGGQVYTNRALTVDSGLNTSNRLRNELADQLDTNRLCRDLKGRSPTKPPSPSTRKTTTGYSIRKILCSGLGWSFPPIAFPCPPCCIRASTVQTGNRPRSRWKKPLPIWWR